LTAYSTSAVAVEVNVEQALKPINTARAAARARVWELAGELTVEIVHREVQTHGDPFRRVADNFAERMARVTGRYAEVLAAELGVAYGYLLRCGLSGNRRCAARPDSTRQLLRWSDFRRGEGPGGNACIASRNPGHRPHWKRRRWCPPELPPAARHAETGVAGPGSAVDAPIGRSEGRKTSVLSLDDVAPVLRLSAVGVGEPVNPSALTAGDHLTRPATDVRIAGERDGPRALPVGETGTAGR
jgi:hypothetical protein